MGGGGALSASSRFNQEGAVHFLADSTSGGGGGCCLLLAISTSAGGGVGAIHFRPIQSVRCSRFQPIQSVRVRMYINFITR